MSTEPGDNGEMVKLNVKVPKRLLEELDELADGLTDTNRSEFIREVLRETTGSENSSGGATVAQPSSIAVSICTSSTSGSRTTA